MLELFAIALGGAAGALARHGAAHAIDSWLGTHFPFGTMFVNIAGSLLIGLAFVLLIERLTLAPIWRSVMIVGFLGAFTTFSTYSLQALALLEAGRFAAAAAYVVGSVVICVAATAAGMALARQLP